MAHYFCKYPLRLACGPAWQVRLLAVGIWFLIFSLPASSQIAHISVFEESHTLHQRFFCSIQYGQSNCARDVKQLRALLARFRVETLGEWQWVIVRPGEWKRFCETLGVDWQSPAMTSFVDHQTFFEGSLFESDAQRASELRERYGISWNKLLPLAVTHELGHAFCRDTTETRAEFFAQQLRRGQYARCESTGDVRAFSYSAPIGER